MNSKRKKQMINIGALVMGIAMTFAELGILLNVVRTETLSQLIIGWLSIAYWLTLMVFIWKGFAKNEYKLDFTLMITMACCVSLIHAATGIASLFEYAHLLNALVWSALAIGICGDTLSPKKGNIPSNVH